MVVVKLVGGLASQLHKYSVMKSICDSAGLELKVDISAYSKRALQFNSIMKYGLPDLGINPGVATVRDIADSKGYNLLGSLVSRILTAVWLNNIARGKFNVVLDRLEGNFFYRRIATRSLFFVHVSQSNDDGWVAQVLSEKKSYVAGEFGLGFNGIEPIRRRLSSVIRGAKISAVAEEYKRLIVSSGLPVSVHIRRGDYVKNKAVNAFHGTCSIEYYHRAIDALSKQKGSRLFFFSDDLPWVKENFADKVPMDTVYVENNQGHEDFILMSHCTSHVIANSGFSSMAAWFSYAQDEMIFSPARWFIDEQTNFNQMNMLPKGWRYIQS